MTDCTTVQALDICPTREQVYQTSLSLLPQGLAWQTDTAFLPREKSVLKKFWYAVSDPFHYLEQRICAALSEFFCSSASETIDQWECDYGVPDDCGLWNNVCVKVGAIGGGDCAYFQEIASQAGYKIKCVSSETYKKTRSGCAKAGCSFLGADIEDNNLYIVVIIEDSPAINQGTIPKVGCTQAGCTSLCAQTVDWLACVFEQIIPAHIKLIFEVK